MGTDDESAAAPADRRAEDPLGRWAQRHPGVGGGRSAPWVRGWAGLTEGLGRPLDARDVHPDAVTLLGVLAVAAALPLAAAGRAWALLAVVPVVVGAVLDGVDGAVAARRQHRTGEVSAWGRVLDPLADRVADLLLVGLLVVLGAPPWPAVALAALTLLLESVRATAQAAGMPGAGAITVWERPSRVVLAALATGLTGLVDLLSLSAPWQPVLAVWVGVGLAAVGLAHLLVAVRRALA